MIEPPHSIPVTPDNEPFVDLVQIRADGAFGTGLLLARGRVLTALHCVVQSANGQVCNNLGVYLLRELQRGQEIHHSARIVWQSMDESLVEQPDVAVLEIDEIDPPEALVRHLFGELPRVPALGSARGFPRSAQGRQLPGGRIEHDQPGRVVYSSETERTLTIDATGRHEMKGRERWAGLSGGPLIVNGLIVGVMRDVPEGWEGEAIAAEPLPPLLRSDKQFRALLGVILPLPEASTQALDGRLRLHLEHRRLGGQPRTPIEAFSPWLCRSRFRGRQNELGLLQDWVRNDSPVSAFVITGVPGIGKTRLAIEFSQSLKDWDVGWLSCHELARFNQTSDCSKWFPLSPTVAIVDDAAEKAQELSTFVYHLSTNRQFESGSEARLRILLLERDSTATSNWLQQIFGSTGRWDDHRSMLLPAENRIRLRSLADKQDIVSVMEDVLGQEGAAASNVDLLLNKYDILATSKNSHEVLGNPLLLQIATLSSEPNGDKFSLMRGIVNMEKDALEQLWQSLDISELLFSSLHKIMAIISLAGGLSISQVLNLMKTDGDFSLAIALLDQSKMPFALKADSKGFVPGLVPRAFGQVYALNVELTQASILAAFEINALNVGESLWYLFDGAFGDPEYSLKVTEWIRCISQSPKLENSALDTFIRRSGPVTPQNAPLLLDLCARRTNNLKDGQPTGESLLLKADQQPIAIASSLRSEARAAMQLGYLERAASSLAEAILLREKLPQDTTESDPDFDIMEMRLLRAECNGAMGKKKEEKADLDGALSECAGALSFGQTYGDMRLLVLQKKRLNVISPKFMPFSDWGLELTSHTRINDLRVFRALLVHRLIVNSSAPCDLVRTAVSGCLIAVGEGSPLIIEEIASLCNLRSREFFNAGLESTAQILKREGEAISASANEQLELAAGWAICLQKFVIGAQSSAEQKSAELRRTVRMIDKIRSCNVLLPRNALVHIILAYIVGHRFDDTSHIMQTAIEMSNAPELDNLLVDDAITLIDKLAERTETFFGEKLSRSMFTSATFQRS